jgi:uncharacterized membrane protein YtjA (UPF0391 family)
VGTAHLFPTKNVVKDFGDISTDNKHIITMEWIVEGVSLIFTGVLCGTITYLNYTTWISQIVFMISAIYLLVMAVVSLFTGSKVNFLPFKLCPFIFSLSAICLILGAVL